MDNQKPTFIPYQNNTVSYPSRDDSPKQNPSLLSYLPLLLPISLVLIIGVFAYGMVTDQKLPVFPRNNDSAGLKKENLAQISSSSNTIQRRLCETTKLFTIPAEANTKLSNYSDINATFSEDGTKIAFNLPEYISSNTIYQYYINGEKQKGYKLLTGPIVFSADGKDFVYSAADDMLKGKYYLIINGKEEVVDYIIYKLVFNPANKKLAYVAVIPDEDQNKTQQFMVYDNKFHQKYRGINKILFSPDGKHLAYTAVKEVVNYKNNSCLIVDGVEKACGFESIVDVKFNKNTNIFSYIAKGSDEFVVSINNRQQQVSRNNIIFDRDISLTPDGTSYFYKYEKVKNARCPTDNSYVVFNGINSKTFDSINTPVSSQDGKKIAFSAFDYAESCNVDSYNNKGDSTVQVMDAGGNLTPQGNKFATLLQHGPYISPDGTKTAYKARDEGVRFGNHLENDFGNISLLALLNASKNSAHLIAISPDSKSLAYVVDHLEKGSDGLIKFKSKVVINNQIQSGDHDYIFDMPQFSDDSNCVSYHVKKGPDVFWIHHPIQSGNFGPTQSPTPTSAPTQPPLNTYSCSDSDGGLNYNVKGKLSGSGRTGYPLNREDECYPGTGDPMQNKLIEATCNSPDSDNVSFKCPNGCQNGVCLPPLVPTGTFCRLDNDCPQGYYCPTCGQGQPCATATFVCQPK